MKTTIKLIVLFLLTTISAIFSTTFGQSTAIGNVRATGRFLGWDGSGSGNSGTLEIWNDFIDNINFRTYGNQKMTILGTSGSDNGFVGIGDAGLSTPFGSGYFPLFRLDVDQGNINLNQTDATESEAYRIGGYRVLWHNYDTTNIFVGVHAGASNITTSGAGITFVGNGAGNRNTSGNNNTFVGYQAGYWNTIGLDNTFVGFHAGFNNADNGTTEGNYNTFTGYRAGEANYIGKSNSFYGKRAGLKNYNGDDNCFVGAHTGDENVSGDKNTFIGTDAGRINVTGELNTALGYEANLDVDGHSNATAIGANAYVTQDNSLILGSIANVNGASSTANTNVGIGTTAPIAKLEVDNASMAAGAFVHTSIVSSSFNIGVSATARNAAINIGVIGQAADPITFNGVAVISTIRGTTMPAIPYNSGVVGFGQGSRFNFGGIFEANEDVCHAYNIGVYAGAVKTCDASAIAGFFNGDILLTGAGRHVSDIKLKDSLQNISGALTIISQLQPKSFVFKTDSFPYMNLPDGRNYGFIAQQVDTVLHVLVKNITSPAIVDTGGTVLQDTMTFKALDYTSLIPIAIRGIQELDSLSKTKVTAATNPTDSNYVVKWSGTSKVLSNSIIRDDGSRLGIPTTNPAAYVNVVSHNDTIGANFVSDFAAATGVVKAAYSTNGNATTVAAISGYSKYVNAGSDEDGIGGNFEGGMWGIYCLGSGTNAIGVGVAGESKNATSRNMGVVGVSHRSSTGDNVGVLGISDSSEVSNTGLIGVAEYVNGASVNSAVLGFSAGSDYQNFGGDFEAWDTVGFNYGVYAHATSRWATAPTAYAGYFNGGVHVVGVVTTSSDSKLKNNIQSIKSDDALASVLKLAPKTYEYKVSDYPYLSLPAGTQYGLIAQDVEQVLPELVSDIMQPETRDRYGKQLSPQLSYKGLNYVGIIPLLISAVKSQQAKIDSLSTVINDRLSALEGRVTGCCGAGSIPPGGSGKTDETTSRQTVELSSLQVIVLDQNAPNPFAEQTSISYFIPETVNSAQIMFFDLRGSVLKTVDVQKGEGILTVFASNLSSGTYSYSLLVDGKVYETKKMVKMK